MTQGMAWEMTGPEALRRADRSFGPPEQDEVLIEVAGCGLCHTDLGYFYEGVRTKHPLPLVLGHEISGFVREAGADFRHLVGEAVVVPAVLPCGVCEDCLSGRPTLCSAQVMPGNDRDGGFASHVVLPGRWMCPVPGVKRADDEIHGARGTTLRHLSVIADAVSTPWQALRRSGAGSGDLVIVNGLGGVGGFAIQLAKALGCHVVGIDVDARKLELAERRGADMVLNGREASPRDLRKQIAGWAREVGAPGRRWVIMECSGSAAGQAAAFGLLVHGATLMVVGYTRATVDLRLSNLMAFDARAIGTWGCDPGLYPELVDLVCSGQIDVAPWTEIRPMDALPNTLEDVQAHRVERRVVLVP